MLLVLLFAGCGLPACERLCEERAACVSATIAAYDSSWEAWTGHADEAAYREACYAEFEAAIPSGDDVDGLCADERPYTCED